MKTFSVGVKSSWRIAVIETKSAGLQYIEKEPILIGIFSLKKMIKLQQENKEIDTQTKKGLIPEWNLIENLLNKFNINPIRFRRQLRGIIKKGDFTRTDKVIHRSETCKKFFKRADTLAGSSERVNCLHLLAAILEKPGDLIIQVLEKFKVEPADLREQAIKLLGRPLQISTMNKIDDRSLKKYIKVLRGGDWEIEGTQSIFDYKVKIQNNSPLVITNVQILLRNIPSGLKLESDKIFEFSNLMPDSSVSPEFRFAATGSCVGNRIDSMVSYTDPLGNLQTIPVQYLEIKYVCNLLKPKQVSKSEFEQKTKSMEERSFTIDSNLPALDLERIIEKIITECNFSLLQKIQNIQLSGMRKIEAFAQGLYDKQDVGLSVALKQVESGTRMLVKVMSDREEKLIDLMRDLKLRMDDIKSDTELIKEYTSQIEVILDSFDDMEEYLKDHLASDWERIKTAWQEYKEGKIGKKELIIKGVKGIGKKFINVIINRAGLHS